MPTTTISLIDLEKLVRKKITIEKLEQLLFLLKAEIEGTQGDTITIKFNDTNLPAIWCTEGLAIFIRGLLGIEKGVPQIQIEKSNYTILTDRTVKQIRPYIAGFVAKGAKIDETRLTQIIQLQEKFCETYGLKRAKVAIGIYPANNITFPITYKTSEPETTAFIPLGMTEKITLKKILQIHPKGKEYAQILANTTRYPLLVDANKQVLSFPPIINAEKTGKVEPGTEELFFEATGTDERAVNLATTIFAYALNERGFKIHSVKIIGGDKTITPTTITEKIKVPTETIHQLLGIKLSEQDIKRALEMMRYNLIKDTIEIPPFRQDIMHPVDIVEDVAITIGYETIDSTPITTLTIGELLEETKLANKIRELLIGMGYQEILTHILTSKDTLYEKTNAQDTGTIEIDNPMSITYSAVRSWILPGLLTILSKNTHNSYPQKLFEEGITTKLDKNTPRDQQTAGFTATHANVDFTEARQIIERILTMFEINATIEEFEHPTFITGRACKFTTKGITIGYAGEIHPAVLSNFNIGLPTVAGEINLTIIKEILED